MAGRRGAEIVSGPWLHIVDGLASLAGLELKPLMGWYRRWAGIANWLGAEITDGLILLVDWADIFEGLGFISSVG